MSPDTTTPRPAGFWRRLAALVIDAWLLTVADQVLDALWGLVNNAHLVANGPASELSALSQLVLVAAYGTVCWGWRGQTVGYVLLQIRLSTRDGGRVGYARAFLRWVLFTLSFALILVPAIVSLILVAIPGPKRALHDLLTGSRVVRLESTASEEGPGAHVEAPAVPAPE